MIQNGYTLVEVLAALFIVGLAMTGLMQGLHVVGRSQAAAAQGLGEHGAMQDLSRQLDAAVGCKGPFVSSTPEAFTGSARGFDYDCGVGRRCDVQLTRSDRGEMLLIRGDGAQRRLLLPKGGGSRFVYRGAADAFEAWPPTDVERQRLTSITLMQRREHGEAPLATSRLWVDQPAPCAFDYISRDCRSGG